MRRRVGSASAAKVRFRLFEAYLTIWLTIKRKNLRAQIKKCRRRRAAQVSACSALPATLTIGRERLVVFGFFCSFTRLAFLSGQISSSIWSGAFLQRNRIFLNFRVGNGNFSFFPTKRASK